MLQQTLQQAKVLQLDVAPLDTLPTLQDIDTLQVLHSLMPAFYMNGLLTSVRQCSPTPHEEPRALEHFKMLTLCGIAFTNACNLHARLAHFCVVMVTETT